MNGDEHQGFRLTGIPLCTIEPLILQQGPTRKHVSGACRTLLKQVRLPQASLPDDEGGVTILEVLGSMLTCTCHSTKQCRPAHRDKHLRKLTSTGRQAHQ